MILIIGGAYQGKLDYARAAFGLTDDDIFTCRGDRIDFSRRCIYALEEFTAHCPESVAYFQAHRAQWQNSVLICRDIFCGVVPMDAQARAWRQNTGLLCQYLSGEASQVIRIFCGLEQRLK
ncbi:MAG: bifunctional adenosylcobinamide kinase/adenosylcobinamide-phosphate guanylyltransferase [Firmicutes bacterium]|nr:bifunctional adenosylcobinamide kinase/adenosylcobinamide-phosphate guanylyltransferase [Bacillota bacterium]